MRIATVIGARPQMIKAAPVTRVIKADDGVEQILIHTGQHYDSNMSAVFFEELDLPQPDYQLGIGSANHGAQTGRMLEAIEKVLNKIEPDWVLLYGDTNTTLAGALAAAKIHIPVAHVEAGLRSFNRKMPEEINRVVADHVSDLLFVPTLAAVKNLRREGVEEESIYLVGDVMYDAALHYAKQAEARSEILKRLDLEPKNYVLATVHRAENTNDAKRARAIFETLEQVSDEMRVVLPLHPRTRNALIQLKIEIESSIKMMVIEPVSYLDMIQLETNAKLIVTDSGGVQKEAYFHKVPCATLREETEWAELIDAGANRLVPPSDAKKMRDSILDALKTEWTGGGEPIFGDGAASGRIVEILKRVY